MEALIEKFGEYGVLGIMVGLLFWQMSGLQKKLVEIIEKNTKAFDELKAIIDKCQVIHRDDDR